MPNIVRYRVRVETRVVVEVVMGSGGQLPVGEYTVRSEMQGSAAGQLPQDIPDMVRVAMEKNTKAARVMAAGVDNMERNRLK